MHYVWMKNIKQSTHRSYGCNFFKRSWMQRESLKTSGTHELISFEHVTSAMPVQCSAN